MKTRRLLLWSLAGGVAITALSGMATAYLAIAERGPGWLRSLCIALGVAATPFWLFAGLLGSRIRGPQAWTIAAALVGNVFLWGALVYALLAAARRLRARGLEDR